MNSKFMWLLPVLTIAVMIPLASFDIPSNNETLNAVGQGHVEVLLYDSDGNLKAKSENHNLIVGEGLQTVWDLAFPDINLNSNATDTQFDVIAIGSGNTAPTAADTGIETAISGCARERDTTVTGGGTTSQVWAYVSVQFSGATCADASVSEAILTNDLTGGEVLGRSVFSDINFGAADTLTVNYNVTLADDGS